jgi:hypothetical protein
MRAPRIRAALSAALLATLALSLATSAEAVPLADVCAASATARSAPLGAACSQRKACLSAGAAHGIRACVVRAGQQDYDALRACTPCGAAFADVDKHSPAATKPSAPKAAPTASGSVQPPPPTLPTPPPAPQVGAPGVVPAVPADCAWNLSQGDLQNLVDDSSWGYCAADKKDCPCSYKPCVVGTDYPYMKVLEPGVPVPESPGWSKAKVSDGQGHTSWMFCTIRSCQIAATIKNTEETALRCWSKPLP